MCVQKLLVALCYVALAPPPRHQHPRCFNFDYVSFFQILLKLQNRLVMSPPVLLYGLLK